MPEKFSVSVGSLDAMQLAGGWLIKSPTLGRQLVDLPSNTNLDVEATQRFGLKTNKQVCDPIQCTETITNANSLRAGCTQLL